MTSPDGRDDDEDTAGAESPTEKEAQARKWLRQLIIRGSLLAFIWTFANHQLFSHRPGYEWHHTALTFVVAIGTWSVMAFLFYLWVRRR